MIRLAFPVHGGRGLCRGLLPAFLSFFIFCGLQAQTTVKETRKLIEEWVGVEKLVSEEASDWKAEKASLSDLAAALRGEIEELDENLAESDEEAAGVSRQRAELNDRKATAENATARLLQGVRELERELITALPAFPAPLRDRLVSYREKLTNKEKRSTLPLRERLETCVAILQAAHLFHQAVNLEKQEFSLDDGRSREFQVLYFGLSRAYFVNEAGSVAGYGTPTASGWKWTRADSLAAEIRKGALIRNKRALPAFLQLPVQAPAPTVRSEKTAE